jgi:hypothetical protein
MDMANSQGKKEEIAIVKYTTTVTLMVLAIQAF